MLVNAETLSVLPVADKLLDLAGGAGAAELQRGEVGWSNEIVLHLVELKTARPAPRLEVMPALFQREVTYANDCLRSLGGVLLGSGMHPWMDPQRDTRIWPHEHRAVYEAFHRVFDCRGHGWSNLQSTHVNLPFSGDEEFGRLHAAVRLLLPLLPALAASSPLVEGRPTGLLDNRMAFYGTNSRRVPSVAGDVVPEPLFRREDYQRDVLDRMYRDVAPFDPERVLQDEFLNGRGAIPRFSRSSIEVRVLDAQECPLADLAIAALVRGVLRLLVEERWASYEVQRSMPSHLLCEVHRASIADAEDAVVATGAYLGAFGLRTTALRASEIWQHLAAEAFASSGVDREAWSVPIDTILARGPLARRILAALDGDYSQHSLRAVYGGLARCLADGRPFP
jgi:gamma-glutamyl:cysteine ligase YbdK (ATP-grasp superfamily)